MTTTPRNVPEDSVGTRRGKAFFNIVLTLPPTDNRIYFNLRTSKGGIARALTDEAKKYKRSVASAIAELVIRSKNKIEFHKDVPYLLIVKLFFEHTENKGWIEGKAQNRYKKIDTTNRNKLLIDAIMEAIGVDDSHIHSVIQFKHCDEEDSRVEVGLYELIDDSEMTRLEGGIEETIWGVLWG